MNTTIAATHVIVSPRRGLSRTDAALYIGVGTTKFDEMVADGRMPKAIRIDGRVIWDIRALDSAFDELVSRDGREKRKLEFAA